MQCFCNALGANYLVAQFVCWQAIGQGKGGGDAAEERNLADVFERD